MDTIAPTATMKKQKNSLQSSNFWNNVVNTLLALFMAIGLDIPEELLPAIAAAVFTIINGATSIYNIAKDWFEGFSLSAMLKSSNFWVSLFSIGTVWFGMSFPADEFSRIGEAITSGDLTLIIVAVLNSFNAIFRWIQSQFGKDTTVATMEMPEISAK